MVTLNWVFSNNHKWQKTFLTTIEAENYANLCGFFQNQAIERAWIDAENSQIWLKEKQRG